MDNRHQSNTTFILKTWQFIFIVIHIDRPATGPSVSVLCWLDAVRLLFFLQLLIISLCFDRSCACAQFNAVDFFSPFVKLNLIQKRSRATFIQFLQCNCTINKMEKNVHRFTCSHLPLIGLNAIKRRYAYTWTIMDLAYFTQKSPLFFSPQIFSDWLRYESVSLWSSESSSCAYFTT